MFIIPYHYSGLSKSTFLFKRDFFLITANISSVIRYQSANFGSVIFSGSWGNQNFNF